MAERKAVKKVAWMVDLRAVLRVVSKVVSRVSW
jgi:hypothetical protein